MSEPIYVDEATSADEVVHILKTALNEEKKKEEVIETAKEMVEASKQVEVLRARNCKLGWNVKIHGTDFKVTEIGESRLVLRSIDRTGWNS